MTDDVTNVDLFVAPVAPVQNTEVAVADLVGEGKKYKSPDDLAKAKLHADRHIEELQESLAALKQELNTRITMEEFVTKVSSQNDLQTAVVPEVGTVAPANTDNLTREQVLEMFKNEEAKKVRATNTRYVQQELAKKFGGDYLNSLNEKTSELGMTPAQVQEMAATAPKALLALFGNVPSTPTPTGRTAPPPSAFDMGKQPMTSNDRDYAYYRNLLKTNPKEYWRRETQIKMHEDAIRLGDNFKKR